jgi:predicted dehydrogenase
VSAAVSVGVVGLGYWGPNLARNFNALPDVELRWICDGSPEQLERVAARFPGVRATGDLDELLADRELDAVAIATPIPTHAPLARRALAASKHTFVEKPLAQSLSDAEQVVAEARESGCTLMVGHLLEYTRASSG